MDVFGVLFSEQSAEDPPKNRVGSLKCPKRPFDNADKPRRVGA